MKPNSPSERLFNGIIKENPILVLILGMCPTLAVTTSAINGGGMGLATTAVLMFSNLLISLMRDFIPDRVRIPAYIVVIASLVTVVQFLLQAYVPSLNNALGVYIPLIVVNCIILGRAESYASKNGAISSFFDGIGMGLGFTLALTILGAFRELLGAGTVFGQVILPEPYYTPITIFILAPGAFFVLSCLVAIKNRIGNRPAKEKEAAEEPEEAAAEASDEKAPAAEAPADKTPEEKVTEKAEPETEKAEPAEKSEPEAKEESAAEEESAAKEEPSAKEEPEAKEETPEEEPAEETEPEAQAEPAEKEEEEKV